MAEYKTYKCDRCNAVDAMHLRFSNVDKSGLEGSVDLCKKCLEMFFTEAVDCLNREEQRLLWRKLHGMY